MIFKDWSGNKRRYGLAHITQGNISKFFVVCTPIKQTIVSKLCTVFKLGVRVQCNWINSSIDLQMQS